MLVPTEGHRGQRLLVGAVEGRGHVVNCGVEHLVGDLVTAELLAPTRLRDCSAARKYLGNRGFCRPSHNSVCGALPHFITDGYMDDGVARGLVSSAGGLYAVVFAVEIHYVGEHEDVFLVPRLGTAKLI